MIMFINIFTGIKWLSDAYPRIFDGAGYQAPCLVNRNVSELEVVLKNIYPNYVYNHNYSGHGIPAEYGRRVYQQIARIERIDNQKLLIFDTSSVEIAVAALYLFRID